MVLMVSSARHTGAGKRIGKTRSSWAHTNRRPSNSTYPTQQLGAGWQAAVSFGDVYDGGKMWVCRYSNGTWRKMNRLR